MAKKHITKVRWTIALREVWAKALESGLYEQGQGSLMVTLSEGKDAFVGHCCLGVLARVCGVELDSPVFWQTTITEVHEDAQGVARNGGAYGDFAYNDDEIENMLRDAANLPKLPSGVENYLIEANDDHARPFKEIAAIVRKIPIAVLNGRKPFDPELFA